MSTDYTLECTSSGSTTEIKIIDALFSDTWEAVTPSDWGVSGGKAGSLGKPEVFLFHGFHNTPHVLQGFSTDTEKGDTGDGSKNTTEGDFPQGAFTWECIRKV